MTLLFLGVFTFSLVVSFAATRQVRDMATRRGWVSLPQHGQRILEPSCPRLGGVPIFVAFSLSLILGLVLGRVLPILREGFSHAVLLQIYVPACLILFFGIYDDLRGTGPYLRFIVQAIAAAMLFAGGLRVLNLPILFGSHSFPWFVGLPLTVLWVVAITNAFNLINSLDGLAAGAGLFSTIVFFVAALVNHSWLPSLMSIALTGSILGFLRFNFNPATILLGDSGSLFIGFLLSALALAGAQKAPTFVAVAIPVVSFGLPILETALFILRRLLSGRQIFSADREHIHHKLLQLGFSHRQVVFVLYAVSGLFALLSLFLLWPAGSTLGLVLAVVGIVIWLGVQHLNHPEFGELRRMAQRTIEQRQIVINDLSLRRAVEELRRASDFDQVRSILTAAFYNSDFDAFELRVTSLHGDLSGLGETNRSVQWSKFSHMEAIFSLPSWKMGLDLVATSNRRRGSLVVYRAYHQRDLQLDVNLLTSEFPIILADALDRVLTPQPVLPAAAGQSGARSLANL